MSESYPRDLALHVRSALANKHKQAPKLATLVKLMEVLYFSSLKTEEGQGISCRIAFVRRKRPDPNPPERVVADRCQHFRFGSEIPFSVRNLVKLSKAADPWVSTIAVDQGSDGSLVIWGLIDQVIHYSTAVVNETRTWGQVPGLFQVEIQGPGEIVVYDGYTFLGSLRQGTLVAREIGVFQHGPIREKLLSAISEFRTRVIGRVGASSYNARSDWDGSLEHTWISTLSRILIGIRRYGHGGALLITSQTAGLRAKYPLRYTRLSEALVRQAALFVRHTNLADDLMERYIEKHQPQIPTLLHLNESVAASDLEDTDNEVTGCVRFLSSLSRVDGLVWLSHDLVLQGFGVEITLKKDPQAIFAADTATARNPKEIDMNNFGTRHRSMMRYCAAYPDSLGFVVSQDGDVRCVTRVGDRTMLWDNIRLYSTHNLSTSRLRAIGALPAEH